MLPANDNREMYNTRDGIDGRTTTTYDEYQCRQRCYETNTSWAVIAMHLRRHVGVEGSKQNASKKSQGSIIAKG